MEKANLSIHNAVLEPLRPRKLRILENLNNSYYLLVQTEHEIWSQKVKIFGGTCPNIEHL